MVAVRYYLAERDSGRPGWPFPRGYPEDAGETETTEIEVDDSTWDDFSQEASRQGISTDQLLRHAALYYLADRDSGRIDPQLLEALEKSGW